MQQLSKRSPLGCQLTGTTGPVATDFAAVLGSARTVSGDKALSLAEAEVRVLCRCQPEAGRKVLPLLQCLMVPVVLGRHFDVGVAFRTLAVLAAETLVVGVGRAAGGLHPSEVDVGRRERGRRG